LPVTATVLGVVNSVLAIEIFPECVPAALGEYRTYTIAPMDPEAGAMLTEVANPVTALLDT